MHARHRRGWRDADPGRRAGQGTHQRAGTATRGARAPPLIVIEGSDEGFQAALVELQAAGWSIAPGFAAASVRARGGIHAGAVTCGGVAGVVGRHLARSRAARHRSRRIDRNAAGLGSPDGNWRNWTMTDRIGRPDTRIRVSHPLAPTLTTGGAPRCLVDPVRCRAGGSPRACGLSWLASASWSLPAVEGPARRRPRSQRWNVRPRKLAGPAGRRRASVSSVSPCPCSEE